MSNLSFFRVGGMEDDGHDRGLQKVSASRVSQWSTNQTVNLVLQTGISVE